MPAKDTKTHEAHSRAKATERRYGAARILPPSPRAKRKLFVREISGVGSQTSIGASRKKAAAGCTPLHDANCVFHMGFRHFKSHSL